MRFTTRSAGRAVAWLCLAGVLALMSACERASESTEQPVEETPSASVETAGLPVLLDLGSDSCVACKTMAPILDEMRETFADQLDVRFVDVRKDRAAASRHGVRIIPTQIFFDADGNELHRHQGFYSREDMLAKWGELGFTFEERVDG
jgi:thioredoxin 1